MRLFVAIELPEEARAAIAGMQKRIAPALAGTDAAVKWTRIEQMHLTLVFVGEVDAPRAAAMVEASAPPIGVPAFTIAFGGVGVFPPNGPPRVLWLGVASGATEVGQVQRIVADRLTSAGAVLDDRPFHPHLTLARWKSARRADARRATSIDAGGSVARTRVDAVTLFESRVSSAGSTYTARARTPLGGPPAHPLQ